MLGALLAIPPACAARWNAELSEDSLQSLVAQEPENPQHWMQLGVLASRNSQIDLAKGYFDEAIKLSGRSGKAILQVGGIWLTQGRVKISLPYLMPNLAHLDSSQLDLLQAGLEKEKMPSVQLIVLRHMGVRSGGYHPLGRKAAALAFKQGDLALCHAILSKSLAQLDYDGARNYLLVSFFLGAATEPKALAALAKQHPQGEIQLLVGLCHAAGGRQREARSFIAKEAKSPSYRDYYWLLRGLEAAADDRSEEAAEHYERAASASWDRLRAIVHAEHYKLYSTTGNKYKADQTWESIKEQYQDADPDLQEFMGRQLQVRGYEKQAKYFYRVVLRKRPGDVRALEALWDDLNENEDDNAIQENLRAALEREPLSCEANTLAMNWHQRQRNDKELIPYARNATVYCYESVEPYYVLGSSLLNLSRPEEARAYFSTYIRKGGDANRVPLNLR
jgi:Tfp pilus assembly protein PilF